MAKFSYFSQRLIAVRREGSPEARLEEDHHRGDECTTNSAVALHRSSQVNHRRASKESNTNPPDEIDQGMSSSSVDFYELRVLCKRLKQDTSCSHEPSRSPTTSRVDAVSTPAFRPATSTAAIMPLNAQSLAALNDRFPSREHRKARHKAQTKFQPQDYEPVTYPDPEEPTSRRHKKRKRALDAAHAAKPAEPQGPTRRERQRLRLQAGFLQNRHAPKPTQYEYMMMNGLAQARLEGREFNWQRAEMRQDAAFEEDAAEDRVAEDVAEKNGAEKEEGPEAQLVMVR